MKKEKIAIHPRTNLLEDDPDEEIPGREAASVLGWVGLAFLIVGGSDFVLTWVPLAFGNPEWEFGTLTAALNGLPVPVLGLAALLVSAELNGRKWVAAAGVFFSVCFLLSVVAGGVLWALSIPLALQAVPPELAIGLKKALLKTSVQGLVYPLLLGYLGWYGWGMIRNRT